MRVQPRRLRSAATRWRVAAGAALAVAGLVGAVAFGKWRLARPIPPAHRTEMVTTGSIAGSLKVPGRLEVESVMRVGSMVPGQVVEVRASAGERVKRGQVLARLDDVEQRAAVEGALAELTGAEVRALDAETPIFDILSREGYLPDADVLDQMLGHSARTVQIAVMSADAQIRKQEAALRLARSFLAKRVIRAPADGVLLSRAVEAGETISPSPPGPPLFTIGSGPERLLVRATVDERYAARVQPGAATLTVPAYPGRRFTATIRQVSLPLSAMSSPALYDVLLVVNNSEGELRAGMSATVSIPMLSSQRALRVPVAALDHGADLRVDGRPTGVTEAAIWLADSTRRLALVTVETGVSDGNLIEVRREGLAAGQRVAVGQSGRPPMQVDMRQPATKNSARVPAGRP